MQTDSFFKRLLPILAVGLLLALAACGGGVAEQEAAPDAAESSPAAEEAADAETGADTPTEEAAEAASEPNEADETTAAAADTPETDETADEAAEVAPDDELLTAPVEPASCTPVEIPTYEAIAPALESDWALGPEDAPLTLIEYGDFQ